MDIEQNRGGGAILSACGSPFNTEIIKNFSFLIIFLIAVRCLKLSHYKYIDLILNS